MDVRPRHPATGERALREYHPLPQDPPGRVNVVVEVTAHFTAGQARRPKQRE
jgi:hypothetical protein